MAYVKIEPSGCCERKGMVQVRFSMYLELGDYGYDKHHVQIPIGIKEGMSDSEIDELPKSWQDNPFHNYFIYVEPDTSESEIMDIAEAFLHEAYIKWSCDSVLDLNSNALAFKPSKNTEAINEKVEPVKAITSVRRI